MRTFWAYPRCIDMFRRSLVLPSGHFPFLRNLCIKIEIVPAISPRKCCCCCCCRCCCCCCGWWCCWCCWRKGIRVACWVWTLPPTGITLGAEGLGVTTTLTSWTLLEGGGPFTMFIGFLKEWIELGSEVVSVLGKSTRRAYVLFVCW